MELLLESIKMDWPVLLPIFVCSILVLGVVISKLSFYQKIFFIVSFDRLIIRCLYWSLTKKARKITAVQYNGKQIHSGMDEPSGRYAKTIVFASTSSFFQWWKIIRARNINAAEQGSYLAGDDFISGQWYFCPAIVRALKASQAMGVARSDGGEVKFLWRVLAKHRL